jgi:hypothetical protein
MNASDDPRIVAASVSCRALTGASIRPAPPGASNRVLLAL